MNQGMDKLNCPCHTQRKWKDQDCNIHRMLIYPTYVLPTSSVNSLIYHSFNFPFSDS